MSPPPILTPRCFPLMFQTDILLGNLLPRSKGNQRPASVWYVSPQDFDRFNQILTGKYILLDGEKDCESEVSSPTTQHFCLVQGPTLRISSQIVSMFTIISLFYSPTLENGSGELKNWTMWTFQFDLNKAMVKKRRENVSRVGNRARQLFSSEILFAQSPPKLSTLWENVIRYQRVNSRT